MRLGDARVRRWMRRAGRGAGPTVRGRSEPSDLRHLFGRRVRELRSRLGLTQRELAHRAGMHPAYIGGVERGERNVTLDVVERLARALAVPAAELMLDGARGANLPAASEARLAALAARAANPADLALALDVASYLLDRLSRRGQTGRAAAEPPSEYS